jgi:hypothetical protein
MPTSMVAQTHRSAAMPMMAVTEPSSPDASAAN